MQGECTLEGQASCAKCKDDRDCDYDECIKELAIAGSAKAKAIAEVKLDYNPGFCDGGGFGGELLDSYFAAVRMILLSNMESADNLVRSAWNRVWYLYGGGSDLR